MVLQAMVTAYALPTAEALWSDGLQRLDFADISCGSSLRQYVRSFCSWCSTVVKYLRFKTKDK
jgi:hypothetical protein